MAELRMRIFSNREKQQTLEELEEQINEFLHSVYQVERVLQSGGDHFTTVTICYWDRPGGQVEEASSGLEDLEGDLRASEATSGGQAGSGETLSHAHELAAQGVRGLALEDGDSEHPGLDSTFDDLRRSSAEGFFPYVPEESGDPAGPDETVAEVIAQSLAEELEEPVEARSGSDLPLGPAAMAWEHALELHRLEDAMLTALETLTAFRASHPLGETELMDFLLSEELLAQMVEQARAGAEELASTLREHALRQGYDPMQPPASFTGARAPSARIIRGRGPMSTGGLAGLEGKRWHLPAERAEQVQQLRRELTALELQLEGAGAKKDLLVSQLRGAIDAGDAELQLSISQSLALLQKRLAELRKDLRRVRGKLGPSGTG